jgi:hypothetical protein
MSRRYSVIGLLGQEPIALLKKKKTGKNLFLAVLATLTSRSVERVTEAYLDWYIPMRLTKVIS